MYLTFFLFLKRLFILYLVDKCNKLSRYGISIYLDEEEELKKKKKEKKKEKKERRGDRSHPR